MKINITPTFFDYTHCLICSGVAYSYRVIEDRFIFSKWSKKKTLFQYQLKNQKLSIWEMYLITHQLIGIQPCIIKLKSLRPIYPNDVIYTLIPPILSLAFHRLTKLSVKVSNCSRVKTSVLVQDIRTLTIHACLTWIWYYRTGLWYQGMSMTWMNVAN